MLFLIFLTSPIKLFLNKTFKNQDHIIHDIFHSIHDPLKHHKIALFKVKIQKLKKKIDFKLMKILLSKRFQGGKRKGKIHVWRCKDSIYRVGQNWTSV